MMTAQRFVHGSAIAGVDKSKAGEKEFVLDDFTNWRVFFLTSSLA